MEESKVETGFNSWNKFWLLVISLYIAILTLQYLFYRTAFNPNSFIFLEIGIPGLLMLFQYRQLRKKEVLLAWIAVAIPLFVVAFFLKSDKTLIIRSGKNAALGLKGPLVFLISFYTFNEGSKKYESVELMIPSKYNNFDREEGRYNTGWDIFSFFFYIGAMILTSQF